MQIALAIAVLLLLLYYGLPSPHPGILTPDAAKVKPYDTVSKIANATKIFLFNSI